MPPIDLKALAQRVDKLPALPEVSTLLLQMLGDPGVTIHSLQNVISRDASLSGSLLKLVNSAYFALPNRISDLGHAITMLGFSRVRGTLTGLSLYHVFRRLHGQATHDLRRFWLHSAVAGGVAKRVAQKKGGIDPEVAFATGLLHDIGKLVLLGYATDDFERVVAHAEKHKCSFLDAEKSLLATTHPEVGAWLGDHWSLPVPVMEAIRWHHEKERFADTPLALVAWVADYVAKAKGFGCVGSGETLELDQESWGLLGLPQETFYELMESASAEAEMANTILEAAHT